MPSPLLPLPSYVSPKGGLGGAELEQFAARYEVVAELDVFSYPTQRPELGIHAFSPLDAGQSGAVIMRRLDE